MAAIKIVQFSGLTPSVDPRNLPLDGAQVAENLDMRFGDFRPSKGPGTAVAVVAESSKSIFRTPSGVWLSSLADTDYVNGQINDAATERVYLTGNAAYPQAWQAATYRQLGVPIPGQPTAVVSPLDEFTDEDAIAAKAATTVAILGAVNSNATAALMGLAPPVGVGTPVAVPDPLYAKVQLHLRFDALTGGNFVDSSLQGRPITHETGVTQVTNSSGPLGAAGVGYAVFAGGSGVGGVLFPEIFHDAGLPDPTWTFDAWVTSTETLDYIGIHSRDGQARHVFFWGSSTDIYRTLWASPYQGYQSTQLLARRVGGGAVLTANVPAFVSIQNTGTVVEVYIDGVLIGSTPGPQSLLTSIIGRSGTDANSAFLGKMDEVRITLAKRYTANFTRPTLPFSTSAVPNGFWVAHGDPLAVSLPTSQAGDAAYLVQMTLVGGTWTITNPAETYLKDPVLAGGQVMYSGSFYWAVSGTNYQAQGKTLNVSAMNAALAALHSAVIPTNLLLTAPQVTELSALIVAIFNPTISPLLPLVTATNSAQANLRDQLATPVDAAALKTKLTTLDVASTAIETYFGATDTAIAALLTSEFSVLFDSIVAAVVQRILETRAYVVTYLTDWDEESAPSLPSTLLTLDQNDGVSVTAAAAPSGRNIIGWKLYRSSTSNTGASFQLVEGRSASNAMFIGDVFRCFNITNRNYVDYQLQSQLQETCPTLTWAQPPAGLLGLRGLPNGIMAGFFGKTLCFCEPFAPFAWPVEYQLTLEFNIVGIGVFGQTAVVLTEGNPYFVSGADSASMSAQKLESPQACIAKRTIASVEGGVIFASPDGLCLAGPNGVSVISQTAFSRADWQAQVTSTAFGAFHDGVYHLFT